MTTWTKVKKVKTKPKKKAAEETNPVGRPSTYTDEIAAEICKQVALGESVRSICASPDFPSQWSVIAWLGQEKYVEFAKNYARAREIQADSTYEEIQEVETEVRAGAIDAQVARVLIDSKKWRAGRMKPSVYGDKVKLEHTGSIETMTDEQLDAKIMILMAKLNGSDDTDKE